MSIESLKAQARRHEQKEEWSKALDQYGRAISALEAEDQPDIALYNRVGDLHVRVGNYDKALQHYERAVELYREAYLPNNAIAVCKKIVRHVPARHRVYLTMGQIRAEQGFVPDARTNFLTYAERMQEEGDLDESFRALVEFCDLVPDDVEVRVTVAEQMVANDRVPEAVEQLSVAYRWLRQSGQDDRAFGVERKILDLAPDTDFDALLAEEGGGAGYEHDSGGLAALDPAMASADDTESALGHDAPDGPSDGSSEEGEAAWDDRGDALRDADDLGGAELRSGTDAVPDEDEPLAPDPSREDDAMLSSDDDIEEVLAPEAEEDEELPLVSGTESYVQQGEDDESDAFELPLLDLGDGPGGAEWGGEEAESSEGIEQPGAQAEVWDAEEREEAGGAEEVEEAGEAEEVETVGEVRALPPEDARSDPPESKPAGDEFVDFGSMVLGDLEKGSGDTRFRVAYQEPSGDEVADFQRMLSQFKEKVSENLEASDVKAHHDLGTAYKEMGLLDEAVGEFQSALRASARHLPTYELLGQTFLEMGKHEAAAKALERALKVGAAVEDDLIGIYYYLARAYEQLGRTEPAVEFYDRVFALDINFADVTDRLRELR